MAFVQNAQSEEPLSELLQNTEEPSSQIRNFCQGLLYKLSSGFLNFSTNTNIKRQAQTRFCSQERKRENTFFLVRHRSGQ
jgi:hypothetical protein